MKKIHSTAAVSPMANLGEDVEVGPGAIIEDDVTVGDGTRIGPYSIIRQYTTLGRGNVVDAHVVLGGRPQDLKFRVEDKTYLRIGDENVFREFVTISRANRPGGSTIVGSRTYLMTGVHVGHDSVVEDECILVNSTVLAGHTTIGRGCVLSAFSGVHQFCWIGERVMCASHSGTTTHVPPFVMLDRGFNQIVGLNVVGMRRSGAAPQDRRQVKEAFAITYRCGLSREKAIERMDACTDWGEPARKFREFVRKVHQAVAPFNRALCGITRAAASENPEE